jgi:hypothetical protein
MADLTHALALIQSLQEKIDILTEQQVQALRFDAVIRMTPEENKEFEARRQQISALIQEVNQLKKGQST